MKFPIGPEDVKLIQGRSKGLQAVCDCGCVNFNYLDPQDPVWRPQLPARSELRLPPLDGEGSGSRRAKGPQSTDFADCTDVKEQWLVVSG